MTGNPPINFGDLLRALHQLDDGDPQTRRSIAALLGFEWSQQVEAAANWPAQTTLRVSPEVIRPAAESAKPLAAEPLKPPADIAAEPQTEDDAWIESLPSTNLRLPRWLDEIKPLPQALDETLNEPPAIDPLFRPDWTRALLYAALATVDDHGPLDVERMVERLASAEPLGRIPRLQRRHLGAGVQVLIDINKTMSPYVEDQRGLLDDIKRVVSAELVREAIFEAVPEQIAFEAEDWQWRAYQPPPRGTLVLALTDLGVGPAMPGVARSTPEAWLAFAERLRVNGCPFVVLTPYPEKGVLLAMRRRIATLRWDRATTTGHVQRTRRDANKGR